MEHLGQNSTFFIQRMEFWSEVLLLYVVAHGVLHH
jgi:hypothetical protein